jgi:hypothetical protein
LLLTAAKTVLAAGVMGLVGWQTLPLLSNIIGTDNSLHQAILVLTATAISGAVFFAFAALLRIEELYWLTSLVRRKLQR